ncbi:MAG: hypothetical protein U0T82_03455 [Bacteroidales bacterium]
MQCFRGIITFQPKLASCWLLVVFLFLAFHIQAQDKAVVVEMNIPDSLDGLYGADPTVFNGQVYVNPNPGARGTPFLFDETFQSGSVTIRGKEYTPLLLRFDTFGQWIVVRYENRFGGMRELKMSDAWIEHFTLGDRFFTRYSMPDGKRIYLQLLGTGNRKIGIYWSKELLFNATNINPGYYFSPDKKAVYLVWENELRKFKNNKSFLKLFPKEEQEKLATYLSKNSIDIRKASEKTLLQLINYCNTLK